jgi:phage shock protein E
MILPQYAQSLTLAASLFVASAHATVAQEAAPAATPGSAAVAHTRNLPAAQLIPMISSDAAQALAEPKHLSLIILDVRTPEEFAAGHLRGAKNLDATAAAFPEQIKQLDPKRRYVVHCARGGRSSQAVKVLEKAGFQKLLHMSDGYIAWSAAQGPVVK